VFLPVIPNCVLGNVCARVQLQGLTSGLLCVPGPLCLDVRDVFAAAGLEQAFQQSFSAGHRNTARFSALACLVALGLFLIQVCLGCTLALVFEVCPRDVVR
jgi:hypothetical protein